MDVHMSYFKSKQHNVDRRSDGDPRFLCVCVCFCVNSPFIQSVGRGFGEASDSPDTLKGAGV